MFLVFGFNPIIQVIFIWLDHPGCENNAIITCLGEEPDIYCYDNEFFDNDNRVILSTSYEDSETGVLNQIFVELIRTL